MKPLFKKNAAAEGPVSSFSTAEILASRKEIEATLRQTINAEDASTEELREYKLKLDEWKLRLNVVKRKLKLDSRNENLRVLHDQALINISLVEKKISAFNEQVTETNKRRTAAKEGLKMLQRMELIHQTGKTASRHNAELREINDRASQLSIESGVDMRDIKRAEFYAQAMTDMALEELR